MSAVLSPAALDIDEWEHDALLAVRAGVAAGRLQVAMAHTHDRGEGVCLGVLMHAHRPEDFDGLLPKKSMSEWLYALYERSPALRPLFAPGSPERVFGHPGWRAQAADVVAAIDAFLAGAGPACWDFMRADRTRDAA